MRDTKRRLLHSAHYTMRSLQSDGIYTNDEEGVLEEEGAEGAVDSSLSRESDEEVPAGKIELGEEEEENAF